MTKITNEISNKIEKVVTAIYNNTINYSVEGTNFSFPLMMSHAAIKNEVYEKYEKYC